MKHIFCVMGKSASGKDSIYKQLVDSDLKLVGITLYTTRPIRDGEIDGKNYHFVTKGEYRSLKESGKVIESRTYNVVGDVWNYFMVDDENIDLNKNDYIVIGTLESYLQISNYFGEKYVIPIFLDVENGKRLRRALDREEKEAKPNYKEMCRRFLADEEDFSIKNLEKCNINRVFYNDEFDDCYEKIVKYIKEKQND